MDARTRAPVRKLASGLAAIGTNVENQWSALQIDETLNVGHRASSRLGVSDYVKACFARESPCGPFDDIHWTLMANGYACSNLHFECSAQHGSACMALQECADASLLPAMTELAHPNFRLRHGWRVLKVVAHLALRPQDAAPYLRYGAFGRKSPIDLGMPWWSFGAVEALSARLLPSHDVFEFGSGGSSLYLARRARSVTCVEDQPNWAERVESEARKLGIGNLTVLRRPLDLSDGAGFLESAYLLALAGRKFDLIVIDGAEGKEPLRESCFQRAEDFIREGGMIIVDDFWRYPRLRVLNRATGWKEYKGTGYCRRGVTSTCIFHY